jgi:hypothetical protein
MVLITDDALLRKFVARGYISRMVRALLLHSDMSCQTIMPGLCTGMSWAL